MAEKGAPVNGLLNRLDEGFYDIYAEDEDMTSVVSYPRGELKVSGTFSGRCPARNQAMKKNLQKSSYSQLVRDITELDPKLSNLFLADPWPMKRYCSHLQN